MKTARRYHEDEGKRLIAETIFALIISPIIIVLGILAYCYADQIEVFATDHAVIVGCSLIVICIVGAVLMGKYITNHFNL